jgi:hypothetical protein
MVLLSNGSSINIKNHHKMKCIEQKNENFNISIINNNEIVENIDDGVLHYTMLNEDLTGKKESSTKTKKK